MRDAGGGFCPTELPAAGLWRGTGPPGKAEGMLGVGPGLTHLGQVSQHPDQVWGDTVPDGAPAMLSTPLGPRASDHAL